MPIPLVGLIILSVAAAAYFIGFMVGDEVYRPRRTTAMLAFFNPERDIRTVAKYLRNGPTTALDISIYFQMSLRRVQRALDKLMHMGYVEVDVTEHATLIYRLADGVMNGE